MAWMAHSYVRNAKSFIRGLTWHRLASTDQAQSVKPFSDIPGPKGLPIFGSLFDVMRNAGKAGDEMYHHQLMLKYGPIVKVTILGNTMVIIGSPEAAEKMYRAEGKYPLRGNNENIRFVLKKNNIANLMVFTDGHEWKQIRSSTSKQIVPRRVANYAPGLCEIGGDFVDYIKHKREPDGYVEDVSSALMKWAFQGIGYMVFGERLNTFDESRKDLMEFQNAAVKFIQSLQGLNLTGSWIKYYRTKPVREFLEGMDFIRKYGSAILKEKCDKVIDGINSGVVDETKAISMMEQWLIEGNLSHEQILVLGCDMLAAGIDTSSNTATFLLHELAKQPELQEKLYKEVSAILGDTKAPSFDDLQKMTLVRNCIKEIMRLLPTVPITARTTDQEIEIHGYQIPPKTLILHSTYTASLNPKYVEDPHSFKPERWAKDSTEDIDGFVSLPFGFGPRSCYGRRLAELELYILLSMVTKNFKLSTQQQSLKMHQSIVIKAAEPVKIKFTDRK